MNQYNITVLGAGGHGLSSLQNLFEQSHINFDIIYNTADWGGSTGLWGRLLEYNNNSLNMELHTKPLPVLPLGDPNKLISYCIDKGSKGSKDIIDFRSNSMNEHLARIQPLQQLLGLDNQTVVDFRKYLEIVWRYYIANSSKIKFKKDLHFGYIFWYFVINREGSIEGLNNFLKSANSLKPNIYFDFASSNRQVLNAKDISLEKLIGEDRIDKHKSPFLPESIVLTNPDGSRGLPTPNLIKKIKESNLVIIPTGSINNWLSIINYKAVATILRKKKIIWLTNPFKTKSELHNSSYLNYFHENNIHPIGYGTRLNPSKRSFQTIMKQDKQGKYLPEQITEIVLSHLQNN